MRTPTIALFLRNNGFARGKGYKWSVYVQVIAHARYGVYTSIGHVNSISVFSRSQDEWVKPITILLETNMRQLFILYLFKSGRYLKRTNI